MTTKPYSAFGAFEPPCNYCVGRDHGASECTEPTLLAKPRKELAMKKIEYRAGFAVAYLTITGGVGYVATDRDSGYPYLSDSTLPGYAKVYKQASKAVAELGNIKKNINSINGCQNIQKDSLQVIEIVIRSADDNFINAEVQKELLERATNTFSPTELEALKQLLLEKK